MDKSRYLKRINSYIKKINIVEMGQVEDILKKTIINGKTIYTAGNGGSLATAMHFAEDVMLQNNLKTKIFSLSNLSCITAIANDYTYEVIFRKQLEHIMELGDTLLVVSASGRSKNLIEAVDYANMLGETIGIVGFDGGDLKNRCRHIIHVPTDAGDYEATEDMHSMICHILACATSEGHRVMHGGQ